MMVESNQHRDFSWEDPRKEFITWLGQVICNVDVEGDFGLLAAVFEKQRVCEHEFELCKWEMQMEVVEGYCVQKCLKCCKQRKLMIYDLGAAERERFEEMRRAYNESKWAEVQEAKGGGE